jgi:DNA-binding transcriptional LysR family regulator
MDMRELRYFAAVFEERAVTAAARRCFVSQPSVTAAIAGLEDELGTRLFIRHKKGVSPTASGDQLYPIARRMLDEAEAVRTLFRTPAPRRDLTIGLMRSLDIRRVLELLRPLTGVADLHLQLVDAGERCDARIISRSLVGRRETFVPLWRERYVVALPPSHELALRDRLCVADLAGLRLVDRCYCEYREQLAGASLRFETVAIAQSEDWALALVAAGIGATILPEDIARRAPGVAVRELSDVDVSREVGLAYGAGAPPSTELRQLIEGLPRLPPRRARALKRRPGRRTARPARRRARRRPWSPARSCRGPRCDRGRASSAR